MLKHTADVSLLAAGAISQNLKDKIKRLMYESVVNYLSFPLPIALTTKMTSCRGSTHHVIHCQITLSRAIYAVVEVPKRMCLF